MVVLLSFIFTSCIALFLYIFVFPKKDSKVKYVSSSEFIVEFLLSGFSLFRVVQRLLKNPLVKFCFVDFRGKTTLFTNDAEFLAVVANDIGTTHAGLIPDESPLYPFFDRHLFSYSTDEWRQFKSLLNIKYWSLSDELFRFIQQQASTYCVAVDDAIEAHEGLVQVKDLKGQICTWYPKEEEFVQVARNHCKAVGLASSPISFLIAIPILGPLLHWIYREDISGIISTFGQTKNKLDEIFKSSKAAVELGEDPGKSWVNFVTSKVIDRDFGMDEEAFLRNYCAFMLAGILTTFQSTSTLLYLLARHEEIQDLCYEEIMRIPVDYDARWSESQLRKLTLLEACLNESLRLYHPTSMAVPKAVTSTVSYKGIEIPKGCLVLPCLASMHRHPEYFPNPDIFDPHRWLKGSSKESSHAFKPFWAGPRACNGRQLAIAASKILVATLLKRDKLTIPSDSPFKLDLPQTGRFLDNIPNIEIKFTCRQ